jgi:hypothetical protein
MTPFLPVALRPLAVAALGLITTIPAFAIDMPQRKAGLWELKMDFEGRAMPATTMKQCVDAKTDKLLNEQFSGPSSPAACSKNEIVKTATGMTIDAVCKIDEATTTTHTVVTGSFDSAYTMNITATRSGGRPIPGMPSDGKTQMTMQVTWLGPCAAGQKPGDVMMPNGMTMNVLDMQKLMPKRPQ